MADIVEGDHYWMELAENGTQPYVQGHMKPGELFRKLKSCKPKQWEAVFKAVIKPECGGLCAGVQEVQGQCKPHQPLPGSTTPQVHSSSTGSNRRAKQPSKTQPDGQ